jgi:DNA adenine methylase
MEVSHDRAAARPLAPYLGGKRNLSRRIVERLRRIPHDLYAEPFVGMGGIFLRRKPARIEVINDVSHDVATLFRILQRHYVPFLDTLRWQLTTRADFDRLMRTDPATLTDLERAARFLYLQRTAYGGKVAGRTFGVSRSNPGRFDLTKLVPLLEEVHERLAGVVIECLPWPDFVTRYDRPGALFYLDPPYWGCEGDYGEGVFARADFERLAAVLVGLEGRFLMSLNDVPEVRRTFAAFAQERVETTYTVRGNGSSKRAGELLISDRRRR